tara:strand:+ start:434 stop:601 length:168 start_codon:yes stop_codon:yes gene_type:complete
MQSSKFLKFEILENIFLLLQNFGFKFALAEKKGTKTKVRGAAFGESGSRLDGVRA